MNELESLIESMRKNIPSAPPSEKTYNCPKCRDTYWIIVMDENGYEYSKRCDCYAVAEAKRLMERSGISLEFQNKGFKNYDTRNNEQLINAKNKAIEYFQSFFNVEKTRYNSIMFAGQVGAGKTHLGTAICSNLMTNGVAVTYMPYRNAITKIKQRITEEADYDKEIARYMQARVLYIDDLLKGRVTESDKNILYEIVNYRYMNNMPLIISTEKSIDELLDFDEAIGSRIIEMCRGNIVYLVGRALNYRLT